MTFLGETYLHYSSWPQSRFDAELAKQCTQVMFYSSNCLMTYNCGQGLEILV